MIPKVIHSVWLGDEEPPQLMKNHWAMLKFLGFQFMLWEQDNDGVGTVQQLGLRDPQWRGANHATSSNMIRLHALYQYGGIYLDADVEVLKDLSPLLQYEEFIARQPDGVFCNAVMGAKAGSAWIRQQLEILSDFRLHDAAHACHIIHLAESDKLTVVPTHWFYPFGHDEPADRSRITDETLCVHHWEGSWLE